MILTLKTSQRLMAFNNAGVMPKNVPPAYSTLEEFDRVTRASLRGVWSCMKHELRQMERQGSGAIVNCSSIGGLRGDRTAVIAAR